MSYFYFCDIKLEARKNIEKHFFYVFLDKYDTEENVPNLTKDILLMTGQYRDFVATYRPKTVLAYYTTYRTENEVFPNTPDDKLQQIIEDGGLLISSSEISITCSKDFVKKKGKRKSTKKQLILVPSIILASFALLVGGMKLGELKGGGNYVNANNNNTAQIISEDGMIIPTQEQFDESIDQITVSIDRSYSSIPTEDLQLKGKVVNGVAEITLPSFDRNDFFTHVEGHTWGFSTDPEGTKIEYYGGSTYSFSENTKLYRILVKYGGGSGTQEDPYLINYFDQLNLMSKEKARGYFKQTENIVFPDWATHTPINTINELKVNPDDEHFEYDGNGFTISNIPNSLFGKVSGATITNVHIKNSVINDTAHKNYGFIVCEAYNYRYKGIDGKTYETGETTIKNCSVSHSAIYNTYPQNNNQNQVEVVTAPVVIPPNLIQYDENGNVINTPSTTTPTKSAQYAIGAITGLGGQIENCYVTDFGIYSEINDYFKYAGGISGQPTSVVDSAVYYFSTYGNIFNAGGIAGNIGGTKLYDPSGKEFPVYYGGNIQGCVSRYAILDADVSCGGIVGEATSNNSESAIISNCYSKQLEFTAGVYNSDGELEQSGVCGGIVGTDGNERYGHHLVNNISPVNYNVIGYQKSSKFDDTNRLAPDHAYYQENILTVLNKNSVNPNNPDVIYNGNFTFGNGEFYDNEIGWLVYPAGIYNLFAKTYVSDNGL